MAKSTEDIQSYLLRMDLPYQEVESGTFLLQNSQGNPLVVKVLDEMVLFRADVMDIPAKNKEAFFRTLLELNASEMLYGSYGIEKDSVVILDVLQLENLDYNEFAATVDDIQMALVTHRKKLLTYQIA